jgi:hypothetical protein
MVNHCPTGQIWDQTLQICIPWSDPYEGGWEPPEYPTPPSQEGMTATTLYDMYMESPDDFVGNLFQNLTLSQEQAEDYGMYFQPFDPAMTNIIQSKYMTGVGTIEDTLEHGQTGAEIAFEKSRDALQEVTEEAYEEGTEYVEGLGVRTGESQTELESIIARGEQKGTELSETLEQTKSENLLKYDKDMSDIWYAKEEDIQTDKDQWYSEIMGTLASLSNDLNPEGVDCAGTVGGTAELDVCGVCGGTETNEENCGLNTQIVNDNTGSQACATACYPAATGMGTGYSMQCFDDCMNVGVGNFNGATWIANLETTLQNDAQCPGGGHYEASGNTFVWTCDDAGPDDDYGDIEWGEGNCFNTAGICGSCSDTDSTGTPCTPVETSGNCPAGQFKCGDGTCVSDTAQCPDSCFHPDSTVELEDGTIKTMREVNYGDMVKAVDRDGNIIYSEVWEDLYFNYKDETQKKYYITIKAGDKTIKLTTMHTVFVNDLKKNINAHKVKPGMYVNVVEGREIVSRMVDSVVHSMEVGKYDLYTREGTVVVDGIVVGTLAFWPHRWSQAWHKFFNNHPRLYKFAYKYIYSPIYEYFYPMEEEYNLGKIE